MITVLQWGRDKNVSEINAPAAIRTNTMTASMGPRQKCLGNMTIHQVTIHNTYASMGPRQKCLGNMSNLFDVLHLPLGFNGAETKMSRK